MNTRSQSQSEARTTASGMLIETPKYCCLFIYRLIWKDEAGSTWEPGSTSTSSVALWGTVATLSASSGSPFESTYVCQRTRESPECIAKSLPDAVAKMSCLRMPARSLVPSLRCEACRCRCASVAWSLWLATPSCFCTSVHKVARMPLSYMRECKRYLIVNI
jgi:hypothetical protein